MKLPALFGRRRELDALRGQLVELKKALSLAYPTPMWRHVWDNYAGAWQQDVEVVAETVLTFGAVFACIRLISTDIGKLRLRLMEESPTGVLVETDSAAFSPLLRKPNQYQTRIKFIENWVQAKLIHGASYHLKGRDARGVVNALYPIAPPFVEPLISESGAVFYRLATDRVAGLGILEHQVIVPAREMIHDVHITPEHPLVGVSPIGACGLAATQGLKIQQNSARFFKNQSRAGVVLSAPGPIKDETAARIKATWETNFGGENFGRTAVLGDGLKPEAFTITPDDALLVEQLKWTGEDVCRAFGVPAYKIGLGTLPSHSNIEALERSYEATCLQELIECIEVLHDEGLDLPSGYCTKFDVDGLMRMDSKTRADVDKTEISAGILAPNEGRAKRGLLPVAGGDSPLIQVQNYSLAALAKRDAKPDPFASAKAPAPAPAPQPAPAPTKAFDPDVLAEDLRRELAA